MLMHAKRYLKYLILTWNVFIYVIGLYLCGGVMAGLNNDLVVCGLSLQIADSLPLSWLRGANVCLPQLQSVRNHLVEKVHKICKQQPPDDPNTR